MENLIFGKDKTQRIVGCEPGNYDSCELFIQDENNEVVSKKVPMTHWILFSENHSPKMKALEGNQHYKYLIEYDNYNKYEEILKTSRLKKYDTYTARDKKEAFMMKNGVTYYKGLKVKDVSVLSFDLEHTYGIGDKLNKDGKLLLISNTFRDSKGNIKKQLFAYDEYANEAQMLLAWVDFVSQCDPSIVIGHNIFGHDFKILRHSARKHGIVLRLGRDNSELNFDYRKSLFRKDGSQSYEYLNAKAYGREIVDTFFLAIKYDVARNYPNYKLKDIIKHEELEKKDRTHYDAANIAEDYLDPVKWLQIKEYAKDDADDSLSLFDLMIPSYFYLCQSIPRSLQHVINSATGGWINSFLVRSYMQEGHSIAKATELPEHTEGGISFAVPGVYKNMYKVDLKSAYPSQVLRFKLYDREKDPKANFLKMVEYFYNERFELKKLFKETKDKYYDNRDSSAKVFLNSAYGVTITNKLNYNGPAIGAKITEETRAMIDMALLWASGKPREYWVKEFERKTGGKDETNNSE